MLNPIQSVLAAEQSAQDQIEKARNEAEEILKGARQKARSIVERSENRTQRAVANHEKQRIRAVTGEIHRMRKQRRQVLHRHVTKLEDELDGIVGDIVAQFWPTPPDGGGAG
jgi:vacuolar-type H+-ATPase subunit H